MPTKLVVIPTYNEKENIEAIEMFSEIKVAGVIGKIENFSNIDSKYNQIIEQCL